MTKNSKNIKNVFHFVISPLRFNIRLSIPYLMIPIIILAILLFSGCEALGLAGPDIAEQKQDAETVATEKMQTTAGEPEDTAPAETTAKETTQDASQGQETASTESISNEEITINVYYANSTGEYIVGEARTVSGANKFVDAISEMMKEPVDTALIKLIPETTKINSVKVRDGVAAVDLSEQFVSDRFVSETVDILLVYSIVNTLTEFEEIHSVQFYIDGTKLDVLGQLDIKDPVFRRSDLIKEQ